MNIAYLFFAYKNPALIERLIARLDSENAAFFLHIDQKCDAQPFKHLEAENVVFTDQRLPVYWAEFSGVRAIMLLMRQALAARPNADYLVLLSGSEYPLRSREYIENFLEAHRGTEYINSVKMPNLAAGKPICRINTVRYPSSQPIARFVFRAFAKAGLADRDYRKHLGNLEPYGGNTWWALTADACRYILDFHENNPHVANFFDRVFAPEEYFIHTVFGNSPFRANQRRSLLYEEWTPGAGHPAMIGEKHLAFFESCKEVCVDDVHGPGEMLFARKFSDESTATFERLDRMIAAKDLIATPA